MHNIITRGMNPSIRYVIPKGRIVCIHSISEFKAELLIAEKVPQLDTTQLTFSNYKKFEASHTILAKAQIYYDLPNTEILREYTGEPTEFETLGKIARIIINATKAANANKEEDK